MAQEENYMKDEDYEHLRRMLGNHGAESLSGLQRAIIGLGPRAMDQEQQEFSPPTSYSAMEDEYDEPMISEDKPKSGWLSKHIPPYMNAYKRMNEDQKLKALTGSDVSEVERLMMQRLMGEAD